MHTDDDELLTAAVGGDRDALSELLRRFGGQVRATLIGRIATVHQAMVEPDDVMQVTYLDAFVNITRFKPAGIGSFIAWLTSAAANNLRDAIKGLEAAKRPDPRRQVAAPHRADESYVALYDMLSATGGTPSRIAGGAEARQIVADVIAGLPADYRAVIQLHDIEGREMADIAIEMKRTPGAVYMLRARAHELMRQRLPSATDFFSR